ncbi:dCMP deaminase [Intoshia linei]|uniref:dCMP deaminase n=1 Tax=Intoshia linei TaxID=1819745 RepID=A0A177B7E8_9BILA|nr:dCMP deaminase [Intoshia linei]
MEIYREEYINWGDYFMASALLSAQRSKDPRTQVGACIVNEFNHIVGMGYNGFPSGISDKQLPWGKTDPNILNRKSLYVCHAEMNAITNKHSANLYGCTMYVTNYPCNECAKLIIQSRIKSIFYLNHKKNSEKYLAAEKLFQMANIIVEQFVPVKKTICLNLEMEESQFNEIIL